jgi:hypothetical protein
MRDRLVCPIWAAEARVDLIEQLAQEGLCAFRVVHVAGPVSQPQDLADLIQLFRVVAGDLRADPGARVSACEDAVCAAGCRSSSQAGRGAPIYGRRTLLPHRSVLHLVRTLRVDNAGAASHEKGLTDWRYLARAKRKSLTVECAGDKFLHPLARDIVGELVRRMFHRVGGN